MSPFTSLPQTVWLASNELAFAIPDGFPVADGHSLVVTRREVATWFDATADEQRAVMELVNEVKAILERRLTPPPDGWNVGLNAGSAAGQTVPHLHVHIIPRWNGDVPDPRGGVRHVIPGKGNYLAGGSRDAADLCTGHPADSLLDRLLPEMPGAVAIDILAAFVQPQGVSLIEPALIAALHGGANIRILAGDYLGISSPIALERLLRLSLLHDWPGASIAVRVAEMARLAQSPASFHPKAWRIERADRTVVWVGSSNLSRAALVSGVEWNLRATSHERRDACDAVKRAFDLLWEQSTIIDQQWIEQYGQRPRATVLLDETPADADEPWGPRPWQRQVLPMLARLREAGHRRALAVVATGMGKTVLAALDARQMAAFCARPIRIIIIAHRAEILSQASGTLRRALGWNEGQESWCIGEADDLSGRLVLASVQKLARRAMLDRLASERFDYAIIDEVHHADAPTWRRVLDGLQAGFVLGLTATPERADGRDIAGIFDDVLACDIGIGAGISEGSLVPFAYHGIKDATDYTQIPWRNGRFDDAELERQLIDSPRMERLRSALDEHPGRRTLVFCCGQRHARFARDWFRALGHPAAAVYAGIGSDDRDASLRDLAEGRLQVLCAVDIFNEGVDLPTVDRVIMLRPTESSVVFTQQLGRGLRTAPGKVRLSVIDFVGNHRVFAWRLRHLLALSGLDGTNQDLRRMVEGEELNLPQGCLLDVEMEAKDLLRQLLPAGGGAVEEAYATLREELGRRPTPTELLHRGFLPQTLKAKHDHWFAFVAACGDLDEQERAVLAAHGDWLSWVETTSLNQSWKMVVLRTLIDAGALLTGDDLVAHAERARSFLLGHPVLRDDLQPSKEMPDHRNVAIARWGRWWQKWPVEHLDPWLSVQQGRIHNRLAVDAALAETLVGMTREIVDWRLADYAERRSPKKTGSGGLIVRVSHASGRPILFLPSREQTPVRPVGQTDVRLPDGSTWIFSFVKVACNVANPAGTTGNQLPGLLRSWFGTQAGLPGTDHRVQLTCNDGAWSIAPIGGGVITAKPPVSRIQGVPPGLVAEPPAGSTPSEWLPVLELAAAASLFSGDQTGGRLGYMHVPDGKRFTGGFIAQVRGQSMEPTIPDGAWCLFRPIPAGTREERVVLVVHHAISDPENGGRYTVKRYRSRKAVEQDQWHHTAISLVPDNAEFPTIEIDPKQAEDMRIVAEFVRTWSAPSSGTEDRG